MRTTDTASRRGVLLAAVVSCLAALPALLAANASAAPDSIAAIEVQATTFHVRLDGGRVLSGRDLVGATLALVTPDGAGPAKVRIDAVEVDPLDAEHTMLVYRMSAIDPATGAATALCRPDAEGERWVFPLAGQWDREGHRISERGFTLTCGGDAQGKCVRFGYKPWKTLADGTPLAAYHQACVHLIRANYCGNRGTTRDGMLIDLYDSVGIQQPDPRAAPQGLTFEAAWNAEGAVCVAHTRVPENVTLEDLKRSCPRLAGHLGASVCTAATADRSPSPVLLYNRSR